MYGHPQLVEAHAAALKPPAPVAIEQARCRNCHLNLAAQARAKPWAKLSPRQLDILLRIARGQKLTEIGKDLFSSVKTISSHRATILVKLNLETNADLVRFVMKHGLDEGGAK